MTTSKPNHPVSSLIDIIIIIIFERLKNKKIKNKDNENLPTNNGAQNMPTVPPADEVRLIHFPNRGILGMTLT